MNNQSMEPSASGAAVCPAGAGAPGSRAATAPQRFERQGPALTVLFIGAFLAPLDYFIVNLALPSIHTGLHATDAQLQLIVSAYASAYAVLLITGGRLGDLFGRKRMFMGGMAAFVLASALCGFATSGHMLVLSRIVQGIAAAVMAPQVLATIRAVVPTHQQTRVMSFYGFVFGLSSIVGQLGGGALITYHPFGLDWRIIFLLNIPVGILAFLGTWRFVPESQPAESTGVDLKGVGLLSLLLMLVIYPMTHGREAGWPAWTFVMFALSVPVLVLFIALERRIERAGGHPLVDLKLFRNPAFATGLVLAFLFYCESAFFLTYGIYLQTGLHWTPFASGIAIMPFATGFIVGPFMSPAIVRRIGSHVLTLGFAMLATGFSVATWAAGQSAIPEPVFYLGLVCAGIGQGLVLPSLMRIVLAEVVPEKAGLASGIVSSTLQIGAAFGTAAISGVFFGALGHQTTAAAYSHAFQVCIGMITVLLFICIALSMLLVRHQRIAARHA
ncbi:MFS transporter [Paraburkholderia sartisoli]|uniref:Drug resistance transporter, EmrB/QacA subfamily n=1 Tax=Paraburkholderia sartisoli TaxID=83784 RepID=A0A1H4F733_9BURK|nr:MFS transporter [Paraburkholderia sartisoli]SEA92608.1 drug resistance transporter, EmrB/QacA subfamily [Paraburkholderia sartisoli]